MSPRLTPCGAENGVHWAGDARFLPRHNLAGQKKGILTLKHPAFCPARLWRGEKGYSVENLRFPVYELSTDW